MKAHVTVSWLLGIALLGAQPKAAWSAPLAAEPERKGENTVMLKEEGFVFADGEYLEYPYEVTALEGCLFVNGVRVRKVADWPIVVESNERPQIPQELLRTAKSFDDLRIEGQRDSWNARVFRWIGRNVRGREERRTELRAFLTALPFVDHVDFPDGGVVKISLRNGETKTYGLDFPAFGVPPTERDILDGVERERRELADRISKGDVFLFFGSGLELSFGRRKSEMDLKLMVEVLLSSRDQKEKTHILQRMAILPEIDSASFSTILTGFKASEHLLERIQRQLKQSGAKPRVLDDIPQKTPQANARTEMEAVDRAMEASKKR